MAELQVHTTDELFAALPSRDVRALLARTRTDATAKAAALRELVGDRYADLLDTADEAAALTSGVTELSNRVTALQKAAHALFALQPEDLNSPHRSTTSTTVTSSEPVAATGAAIIAPSDLPTAVSF